jgi:hypothetical protein
LTTTKNSPEGPKVHAPNCDFSVQDQDGTWRDVFFRDTRFGPAFEIFDHEVGGTRKKVYVTLEDFMKVFHRGRHEFGRMILTYAHRDDTPDWGRVEIKVKPLRRDKQVVAQGFCLMPLDEETIDALAPNCKAKVKAIRAEAKRREEKAKERAKRQAKQMAAAKAAKKREIEKAEREAKEAERRAEEARRNAEKVKAQATAKPHHKPKKRDERKPASPEQVERSKSQLLKGKKGKTPHRKAESKPAPKPRPDKPREERQAKPEPRKPRPPRRPKRQPRPRRRQPDRNINSYDRDQQKAGRAMMAHDEG